MTESLPSSTHEQNIISENTTEWDNLIDSAESWQDHLEKAEALKSQTVGQENQSELYFGMKPAAALEHLSELADQGRAIDINELAAKLDPVAQVFYQKELAEYGLDIDEDAIMAKIGDMDQTEIIRDILEQGASVERISSELGVNDTIDHLDLFSEYNADFATIFKSMQEQHPDQIYENLEAIAEHGIPIDLKALGEQVSTIQYQDIDKFVAAGLSVDRVTAKLKSHDIVENLDELFTRGASSELLIPQMTAIAVEANFEKLAKQASDINEFAETIDAQVAAKQFDYLVDHGASVKEFWGNLPLDYVAQNLDKLRENGLNLDINPDQSMEEVERDYYLCHAEWNLAHDNARAARLDLAEGVYGTRFGSICREMVAFGAVKFTDEDRRELRSGSYSRVEDFYETQFSRIGKIEMSNLNELYDNAQIDADDASLIAGALKLICSNDEMLSGDVDFYKNIRESLRGSQMGETLKRVRENLCKRSARAYSEYMAGQIAKNAKILGNLPYEYHENDGKSEVKNIPIMQMEGDEWMMLVHRLGAIYSKSDDTLEHPELWDTTAATHRAKEDNGASGYVSTSAIGDQSLDVAGGSLEDGSPLFYCFTNLDDGAFLYSAEYDLYTQYDSTSNIEATRQDFFYDDPKTIVEKTRDRLNSSHASEGYNEVVLNRYPEGDDTKRIHPNYLAVFSDNIADIQEPVKRHAAYFGVPIMLIDPHKYGRSKHE